MELNLKHYFPSNAYLSSGGVDRVAIPSIEIADEISITRVVTHNVQGCASSK